MNTQQRDYNNRLIHQQRLGEHHPEKCSLQNDRKVYLNFKDCQISNDYISNDICGRQLSTDSIIDYILSYRINILLPFSSILKRESGKKLVIRQYYCLDL